MKVGKKIVIIVVIKITLLFVRIYGVFELISKGSGRSIEQRVLWLEVVLNEIGTLICTLLRCEMETGDPPYRPTYSCEISTYSLRLPLESDEFL